jgi:hypothetical protein
VRRKLRMLLNKKIRELYRVRFVLKELCSIHNDASLENTIYRAGALLFK